MNTPFGGDAIQPNRTVSSLGHVCKGPGQKWAEVCSRPSLRLSPGHSPTSAFSPRFLTSTWVRVSSQTRLRPCNLCPVTLGPQDLKPRGFEAHRAGESGLCRWGGQAPRLCVGRASSPFHSPPARIWWMITYLYLPDRVPRETLQREGIHPRL